MEQIQNDNIQFKRMDGEDLHLLHQWFQIPHVSKWYARGESYSLKMIQEKYLLRINNATILSFIIYDGDKAVGYIQFYYVTTYYPEGIKNNNHPVFKEFKPSEVVGIDLFIADKNYLHTGFSSKSLHAFINKYIRGRFKAVLVDPDKGNIIAIRFFERNGFVQLLSQDDQHILMVKNIMN